MKLSRGKKIGLHSHSLPGKRVPRQREYIFSKFHEDWTKIVDFLSSTNLLMFVVFSYSDFKILLVNLIICRIFLKNLMPEFSPS